MSTRQVFTTDVSVSLLCRFCMQIFEFEMERVQAKRSTKLRSPTGVTPASEKKKIIKKLLGREIKTFQRKMRRVRPVKNNRIHSQAEIPQVLSSRHNVR